MDNITLIEVYNLYFTMLEEGIFERTSKYYVPEKMKEWQRSIYDLYSGGLWNRRILLTIFNVNNQLGEIDGKAQ